jgi:hypothetical protein
VARQSPSHRHASLISCAGNDDNLAHVHNLRVFPTKIV